MLNQAAMRTIIFVLSFASATAARGQRDYESLRKRMVDEAIIGAGVNDPRVVQAMLATPRHEFVPFRERKNAYFDMALPIGDAQTISSPFIVAYMTQSLDPQPADKVLEIGTGSGYQAAVLSPLVKHVYSIEIVESLGRRAEQTLSRLNYENVSVKVGDGFQGWPEHAPFNKIIVTCSPEEVPQPLIEQLAEGGMIVIPVGERYQQTLYVMRKKDGQLQREALRPTLFVPMTGRAENDRQVKPDPLNPRAANGGFEEPLPESGFLPGWYYQRQLTHEQGDSAPEGRHYATLKNSAPGRAAHVLQGLPIDGAKIGALRVSAWVRFDRVTPGNSRDEFACLAVTFYDEDRKDLGAAILGPFQGSSDWRKRDRTLRVPPRAKEALLRIGLFGATGEISFDSIELEPIPR